ncbi:MAG: DNA polymerase IV [Desulfosarcinaceae bacterium]
MASPSIFHIDMDAFFASVEQLDNPLLKGKCLVVGGISNRGVVAAASYEARRYGIHSAMPIFQAKQKCARLVIVPPRRGRYAELSRRIMQILADYSPAVEPVSIDEAYLDITGCERLRGTPADIAMDIKARIRREVGLTCSVGAAPVKFLAKIASDMNKPDGLTLISGREMMAVIDKLDIRKVPGVGKRAFEQLSALGITTLGQVRDLPAGTISRKLGKFGHRLIDLAHGRDDATVGDHGPAKSMSSETTFEQNTLQRSVLETYLLAQSQSVARQLRKHDMVARTIVLKMKTADFRQHTRSHTLEKPAQTSEAIFKAVRTLLDAYALKTPLRLIGVAAAGLQSVRTPVQACLFPEDEEKEDNGKWGQVDRAVDAISDRFGGKAVLRGSLTPTGRKEK